MKQDIPDYEPLTLRGTGTFGQIIEAYARIKDIRITIKRTPKLIKRLGRELKFFQI